MSHTHKRTHSVLRDTQGGWNVGQGSDAILTHVSVAAPLIKLMGNDHRLDTVESGETRQGTTHTVSTVIHKVDGISDKDLTQS